MTTAAVEPRLRPASKDDLGQILDILNHEITASTSSWTTSQKSLDDVQVWFEDRLNAELPIIVADIDGQVAGYASYGPFRSGEGYSGTVEHTVYVARAFRRQGIARQLLQAVIAAARQAGLRRMVGGVSSTAQGSLALHSDLGFEDCGRLPGVGRKFGRSLDLVFMVYRLDGAEDS